MLYIFMECAFFCSDACVEWHEIFVAISKKINVIRNKVVTLHFKKNIENRL